MSPRCYDDGSGGSDSWAMGLDGPRMTDQSVCERFSERFTVSVALVEEMNA